MQTRAAPQRKPSRCASRLGECFRNQPLARKICGSCRSSQELQELQELQNGASDFWSMESQLALDSEPAICLLQLLNSSPLIFRALKLVGQHTQTIDSSCLSAENDWAEADGNAARAFRPGCLGRGKIAFRPDENQRGTWSSSRVVHENWLTLSSNCARHSEEKRPKGVHSGRTPQKIVWE